MPLRAYHAHQSPPSTLDHTLAHPWEVGIAVFQILGGVLGVLSLVVPGLSVSASFDKMAMLLAGVLCLMLLVGGVATVSGIYDDSDDLMVGYRRERVGLVLGSTAWAIYFVVVLYAFPNSILGWAFGLVLSLCGWLRLWATFREEHRLRQPPALPEA